MAYNSSNGVCFEAIKDIKAGEELMALFDSLKGTVVVKSYWAKVRERESKEMKGGGEEEVPFPPPSTFPFFSFFFFFFNFVFALVKAFLMNGCTQKGLLQRLQLDSAHPIN